MARANRRELLTAELKTVWELVTDNGNASWRSDVERIEVHGNGKRFTEYTRDGFATDFTVTVWEEGKRYEFDMENRNISGHWTGIFRETDGGTEIDFTEEVTAKNPVLKPFVGIYLKKQQKQYVEDLKRALMTECHNG